MARVAIRFSDLDVLGHVNHARYLTYCEDHRTEFFRAMAAECGSDIMSLSPVIARLDCEYLRPLTLRDQEVAVACTVRAVGRSSMTLRYEVRVGDELAAIVNMVLVSTDQHGRSRALTAPESTFLRRFSLSVDR